MIRAKMSRLGDAMRSLTADVRISTQFHREPARALLREAHTAPLGWPHQLMRPGCGFTSNCAAFVMKLKNMANAIAICT